MRALLIGLFIGYFLIACAPLHWRGAHLAGAALVGMATLALLRYGQTRSAPQTGSVDFALFTCGLAVAALLLGAALVRVQTPDEQTLRCIDNTLLLRVQVTGLPRSTGDGSRFNAAVLDVDTRYAECAELRGATLRMAWREAARLVPGQVLLAEIRLRPFRGSVSPGAFDHELNALRQGLFLSGYVIRPLSLRETGNHRQFFAAMRLAVRSAIAARELPYGGVLLALITGDTQMLEPATWELLQDSGTVHLLIISGLHVGMVSVLLFGLVRLGVRAGGLLVPGFVARTGGLAQALLTSGLVGLYVLFVGAGVPAVRAWIMATVALLAWSLQRRIDPAGLLLLAAVAVTLIDGLAPLAPGFWLSFGLVGWLLFGASPQPAGSEEEALRGALFWQRWIRPLLKLHLGCSLILTPLLGWSGLPLATVGPLANALAVPVVSLFLVPAVLLGVLLHWLSVELAGPVFFLVDRVVAWLFVALEWLIQVVPAAMVPVSSPIMLLALLTLVAAVLVPASAVVRVSSAAALVLWLLPTDLTHKAEVGLMPVFAPEFVTAQPGPGNTQLLTGEFSLHVLDVGQGLAVLVRTAEDVAIYDTGAGYPSGFNFADAVVIPALQQLGVVAPEVLVVSHPDNDHAGGSAVLQERFLGMGVVSSVGVSSCRWPAAFAKHGAHWSSAGVTFELLQHRQGERSNNRSCVMVVRGSEQVAVLAGDIEELAERALLPHLPTNVDVLIVPHHGSKTSSAAEFVTRLQPRLAIVSAGYANRFGHPHPSVVDRYERLGSRLLVTAQTGTWQWHSSRPGAWVSHRQLRASRWQLGAPLAALLQAKPASAPVTESFFGAREPASSSRRR